MPDDAPRIELTDPQRQHLWRMARRRDDRPGSHNAGADRGGLRHVEAHYVGLMGEGAFALFHGLTLADVRVFHQHGDDGIDFDLADGSWQIKTTRASRPRLRLYSWEKRGAQKFALVHYAKPRTCTLLGWTTRERLLEGEDVRVNMRSKPGETFTCKEMPVEDLWPFDFPDPNPEHDPPGDVPAEGLFDWYVKQTDDALWDIP